MSESTKLHIQYRYPEERVVALFVAQYFNDTLSEKIIQAGKVYNVDQANHLAAFFWRLVDAASCDGSIQIPVEGSLIFWSEKLYNSFGGYFEQTEFAQAWEKAIDRA